MKLQFPESQLLLLSGQYVYPRTEDALDAMVDDVRRQKYMTPTQLHTVALWKSPRSAGYIRKNDPAFVEDVTKFALGSANERSRIQSLTILDGVAWPTASVLLHWFHVDDYPILDFRALFSVGLEVPSQYSFAFWWSYVEYCRQLARRNNLSMRQLDRALWQYSKAIPE